MNLTQWKHADETASIEIATNNFQIGGVQLTEGPGSLPCMNNLMNKHTVQNISKLGATFPSSKMHSHKAHAERLELGEVCLGFGMLGLMGRCIAIPAMLGFGLGAFIDWRFETSPVWMLALFATGAAIGSVNAWHWVAQESASICKEERDR